MLFDPADHRSLLRRDAICCGSLPETQNWPLRITSIADLRQFVIALHRTDRLFHFDDDPASVVCSLSGAPLFPASAWPYLRALVADCDQFGGIWAMMESEPEQVCHRVIGIAGPDESTPSSITLPIQQRDLATILAALRHWQHAIQFPRVRSVQHLLDVVATDCGSFDALSTEEISDLCERLNFSSEPTTSNATTAGGARR